MKKSFVLALGGLTTAVSLFITPGAAVANSQGGGSAPVAACVANYSDIDLASRSMSWGVYCPQGGHVYVDAQLFYGQNLVTLPDAGAHTLVAGETWTIWTQDNTNFGRADHGVLHIVQEQGNGPASVLAHKVK